MMSICTKEVCDLWLYGTRHILVITIFNHGLNVSFDIGLFLAW